MKTQSTSNSNQNNFLPSKNVRPPKNFHVEVIDGATYEVTSNYIGDLTLLDIFKQMLKRDVEQFKS